MSALHDAAHVRRLRDEASELEARADELRDEADEIEEALLKTYCTNCLKEIRDVDMAHASDDDAGACPHCHAVCDCTDRAGVERIKVALQAEYHAAIRDCLIRETP